MNCLYFTFIRNWLKTRRRPLLTLLKGLVPLLLLGFANNCSASSARTPEVPTSLDIAQIQRDIDAAADGAVISIPEGTVLGGTAIIINKGITIKGVGIGKTYIDGGGFVVNGREGHPFRITGFSFQNEGNVSIRGDCKDFRVDHCEFAFVNSMGLGVLVEGYTYGVIDNCYFRNCRVLIYEARYGDAPWKRPLSMGTANAVYVEDCTFWANIGPNAIDANGGGRYVFRYNTTTNMECEAHGLFNAGMRGTFSYEIYGNTFKTEDNGKPNYAAVLVRGGTGVIFDNTVTNGPGDPYDIFGHMYDQRSCNFTSAWGPYDGTSPTDQNTPGMSGYAGRDQIGRSTDYSATEVHPQAYEPVYNWNNTLDGRLSYLISRGCELSQEHIQLDRDFINGPRPGYTPYTYPHPLRRD